MPHTPHTQIRINEDDVSKFYIALYHEALKKADRVNDIKVSLLKLSLISTFAYFAWLLIYQHNLSSLAENVRLAIWSIPLVFNLFGFGYNSYLKATTSRYGRFMRYLLGRTENVRHIYDEFLAAEKTTCFQINSGAFWIIICIVSILFALWGYNATPT